MLSSTGVVAFGLGPIPRDEPVRGHTTCEAPDRAADPRPLTDVRGARPVARLRNRPRNRVNSISASTTEIVELDTATDLTRRRVSPEADALLSWVVALAREVERRFGGPEPLRDPAKVAPAKSSSGRDHPPQLTQSAVEL